MTYEISTIPALRLVAKKGTFDRAELGNVVGPMFDAVAAGLQHIPGALDTPIATYDMADEGLAVVVGYAYDGDAPAGTEVVELPEELAVCTIHRGKMSGIGESWQALHEWVVAHGYEFAGPSREHYVDADSDDQSTWVTELQQPIRKR